MVKIKRSCMLVVSAICATTLKLDFGNFRLSRLPSVKGLTPARLALLLVNFRLVPLFWPIAISPQAISVGVTPEYLAIFSIVTGFKWFACGWV